MINVLVEAIELTACWSTWPRRDVIVLETLENVWARLLSAFITPVRPALEVGACEAVAKAEDRLVSWVARD